MKDQMNSNIKNISNIDLGKCEERLKNENGLNKDQDLIIFKVDIKDENQSTTYVQYEIYNPETLEKLELNICNDLEINIYTPVYLDNEAQSLFSSLKESGYNLFNSSDSFYNDFCTPYTSIAGTDILLKDRKKDIFKKNGNKELCQDNCKLEYYNEITQKAKCNCAPQINTTNLDLLHAHQQNKITIIEESFFNTLSNSNFQVLKCYKLAIDLEKIYENIGRIIMTCIAFLAFVSFIVYFICEHRKLKQYLSQIINRKWNESQNSKDLNSHTKRQDKKGTTIHPKYLDKKDKTISQKYSDKNQLTNRPKKLSKKSLSFHIKRKDNNQKSNTTTIERKKRAFSTHKKMHPKFNINNDEKDTNFSLNKIKKYPSHQGKKSNQNVLNINKNSNKNNTPFKKRRNKKSLTSGRQTPIISKKKNFHPPPLRKPSLKKINNKNNIISKEEKFGAKQNIIFSNNIYIKMNNKGRNKYYKGGQNTSKNSKELLLSPKNNEKNMPVNSIEKLKKVKNKEISKYFTNQELNNMDYKQAIIYDHRTCFQYYWSLIKKKQIIFFVLLNKDDYNLISVKVILLIISFALYFTLNGFFFNDSTMHKIYKNNGTYDIISQIPIIFYSSMITAVLNLILKSLSLSEKNILAIKQESSFRLAKQKSEGMFPCLKCKIFIFFILSFSLILFFWYFISCFCAVYKNTQLILIKDTLASFGLSMIYPFGIYLVPVIFRIPALRSKSKNKECVYKTSVIISLI